MYTQNNRSYQVYSLSNGRLGMRHSDTTIDVPVAASEQLISTLIGDFPVNEAEELEVTGAAPATGKKKRARRLELRAAVSTFRAHVRSTSV